MSRLIDADAFVNMQTFDPEHEEWYIEKMTIAECLDNYADEGCPPTIDAVEVVRCKDCIYGKNVAVRDSTGGVIQRWCSNMKFFHCIRSVENDDYCSYGKRRER